MVYFSVTELLPGVGSSPAELTVDVDVNVPAFEVLDTGTTISIHRPVFAERGPRLGTLQLTVGHVTLHFVVVNVMPFKVHGLLEQETREMVALGLPRTTPVVGVENVVVTVMSSAATLLRFETAAP